MNGVDPKREATVGFWLKRNSPSAIRSSAGQQNHAQRRAVPLRLRLRKIWLKLHLYLALGVGVLIALLGVTGSLMVFHKEIDRQLNPQLLASQQKSGATSLEQIYAAVENAKPPAADHWTLEFPEEIGGVFTAHILLPTQTEWVDIAEVYVDPATAKVLGSRLWGDYLTSFVYNIHFSLLLRDTGQPIVGFIGLFFLMSLLTGLYLWWPRPGCWKKALAVKRSAGYRRFNFDLHKATGAYVLIILLSSAISGVYLVFPRYVEPVIESVAPLSEAPEDLVSVLIPGRPRIGMDRVLAIAKARYHDAVVRVVAPPHEARGVYEINLRRPGEVTRSFGLTDVWVDQYSGTVLRARDSGHLTAADQALTWLFPLHNGEAFGMPGRLLILVAGWAPLLLLVTGLTHWWGKRRHRRVE